MAGGGGEELGEGMGSTLVKTATTGAGLPNVWGYSELLQRKCYLQN